MMLRLFCCGNDVWFAYVERRGRTIYIAWERDGNDQMVEDFLEMFSKK